MNTTERVCKTLLAVAAVVVCGLLCGGPLSKTASAQVNADAVSTAVGQSQLQGRVPPRITQAIDESKLVTLKGNVHPLARPEFDRGPVSDAQPMQRMLLLLQRSPEQEAALRQLLDDQQTKDSPNFHKWLTPQEFGQHFGPADADVQTVVSWLQAQGFTGIKVGAGRVAIEFSGNVGMVRNAFHTEINKFVVNGKDRQANVSDPQIPAALSPVVAGIVSLNNFPRKSMSHRVGTFTHTREGQVIPQFTSSSGQFFAVGPADFAKIYNIPANLDGTGAHIAIIGSSNINLQDVQDFRTLFGLPLNPPQVVLNGPDPGIGGEEGEADLDVQWSGAVAPGAHIDFIVTEDTLTDSGIDMGAFYVIDNNTDDIMSLSFGSCEPNLGSGGNAFFNALWEQAAAQGITVTVSAGDNGSAGCDDFNNSKLASNGLAVNGIASTPFNIAVGGTDFDDFNTQATFWNSTNVAGTRESAKGYIHEIPWNDSCAAGASSTNLNTVCAGTSNIVAASGGPSAVYLTKPLWQNGVTPADNRRDLPDVSLFASDGPSSKSFYVVCQADALPSGSSPSCNASNGSFSFEAVGGTSASAPSFAAIVALIGQSEAGQGRGRRQGNANFVLYSLARTPANLCDSTSIPLPPNPLPAGCVFFDVTHGNNAVPCTAKSANCSNNTTGNGVLVDPAHTTTPAWTAGAGYDFATGLGTVNVTNLAANWGGALAGFKTTTTSLTINGGTSQVTITHGATVNAAVTVSGSPGTPTGDISLLVATSVNGGIGSKPLPNGSSTVTLSTSLLPGSNGSAYNVTAHYSGDGKFAASDSNAVPVLVNKEASHLLAGIVTFDPNTGNIVSTNATTFPYGSPYIFRADVLNSLGTANNCQPLVQNGQTAGCAFDATGVVTITDNGNPLDTGNFKLNSEGHTEDQPIQLTGGTHTVVATYTGDISYTAAAPVTLSLTVLKATTAAAVGASPNTGVTTTTPIALTATITSASNSQTGTSGTVTFFSNGAQIGSPATVTGVAAGVAGAGGTATLNTTFTTPGVKSITATYNGDANYATSNALAINISVAQAQLGNFTVSGTAATVTAGSTGTSTITVTPSGGFTGTVAVTCPTSGLPPGATCSPSPLNINVPGATPVTGTLTLSVAGPSSALSASAQPQSFGSRFNPRNSVGWMVMSGCMGFCTIFLLLIPYRRRYRLALGAGLACAVGFALGCGGGSSGTTGGGLSATNTSISVVSTKIGVGSPGFQFTVTVSGGSSTPTGQVEILDQTTGTTSNMVPLTNGSVSVNLPLSVGTHSVIAKYLGGDAKHGASQSGTLNCTTTGTTQVAISGSPAASNGNPAISLTIN